MTAATAPNASAASTSTLYASGQFGQLHDAATPSDFGLPRYWPSELLAEFTLQMSARGQCVSTAMMLGSREYAIEKLSHAHTLGDESLRAMVVCMFSYFDDEPCHAVAQLVGSSMHH